MGLRAGRTLAALALLTLLVLAADGRTLLGGFVSYDDEIYVSGNSRVSAGLTPAGVAWAIGSVGYASNWHPLTWLSHMADVSLFGLRPWGHHLTSLLLHLANTLLLFAALRHLTGAQWRSFLAAALFGVHPLHLESVAWVSERKDVLAACFWMLALLAWGRWVRRPSPPSYLAAVACLALGLTAKPMVITLPAILLLVGWWPLGRAEGLPGSRARCRRQLGELAPFVALAAASAWVTWLAQQRSGATSALELPLWARAANALVAYAWYPIKALLPTGLSVFYPHPGTALALWKPAAAGAALLVATWLVARERVRRPYLAFGWAWYLITLLPVAGLVQVGWQARADRYSYLPLVGLFVMASWGLAELAGTLGPLRARALIAGAAAWLVVLAGASWVQAGYWRDSVTLFRRAIDATGGNWLAEYSLGTERWRQGRPREAEDLLRKAIAGRPDFADAHNNLGAVLLGQGRFADALPVLRTAVTLSPADPQLHFNLGLALERTDPPAAAREYREALRLDPGLGDAAVRLGIVRWRLEAGRSRGR